MNTDIAGAGTKRTRQLVSVVMPVFNEAPVLRQLVRMISSAFEDATFDFEIVFVNDGSSDDSPQILNELARSHACVRVVHLSRNFGHQPAVSAGLRHATGDAVILMDADMQDDPRALLRFVQAWQEGAEVVYAVRTKRKEGAVKRALFHSFYRILNCLAAMPLPTDAGNFSLMDRRVVDEINRMPESDRYLPGLRNWVGFRQVGIEVERLARHDDQPRVSTWQLFRLAKTAVFGFSAVPLSLFYLIAAASLLVCAGASLYCLYHKFFTGLAIPGWSSITISASFFGALNALGIGVLGEYVARIYDQVRQRPTFVVAETRGWIHNGSEQSDKVLAETLCDELAELRRLVAGSLTPPAPGLPICDEICDEDVVVPVFIGSAGATGR